ncbi:MAG: Glu/Leu/Phe/Val dehydrogenase dimerization domain-containing protein [bacterium]
MKTIEMMAEHNHEEVVFCYDKDAGLRAIIAIHDTTLGPSLGGTRMWPYQTEDEALQDVLRLSRGMTYKAAAAGLNLGGGKAVIIGDPQSQKSEMLFRAFGRFVEGLAGRYITAEDVGTEVRDMEWVRMETQWVTGISEALGGSGDPSPVTAVEPDRIFDVETDVFAPCALGAIINDETIPRLKCKIIAGGANNQLNNEKRHGKILKEKNIVYAPDYVINAGGLINVANEIEGYNREKALKQAEEIYPIVKEIFEIARQEDVPTNVASDRLAERRIEQIAKLKRMHLIRTPKHIRGKRYDW